MPKYMGENVASCGSWGESDSYTHTHMSGNINFFAIFNECIADMPHWMHVTKFLCHHDVTSFHNMMMSLMMLSHAHVWQVT